LETPVRDSLPKLSFFEDDEPVIEAAEHPEEETSDGILNLSCA
jgi:hypothetical protein